MKPLCYKSKYPRFFVLLEKSSILYLKINRMYGNVLAISKHGHVTTTSWTENDCEYNVKMGFWKEIDNYEAALL